MISVKKIAALMYGKAVPVERAMDCFNACMALDDYYVSCAMKESNSIWNKNPHLTQTPEYYSMSLKRWIRIDGNAINQHDSVWPEISHTVPD